MRNRKDIHKEVKKNEHCYQVFYLACTGSVHDINASFMIKLGAYGRYNKETISSRDINGVECYSNTYSRGYFILRSRSVRIHAPVAAIVLTVVRKRGHP